MRPIGCSCVKSGMGMRMTKRLRAMKPTSVSGGKAETKLNLKVATPKRYVSFT